MKDKERIQAAERDIAALLWLNGNCEYCTYGRRDEYSGANRWKCARPKGALDCKPIWRYAREVEVSGWHPCKGCEDFIEPNGCKSNGGCAEPPKEDET